MKLKEWYFLLAKTSLYNTDDRSLSWQTSSQKRWRWIRLKTCSQEFSKLKEGKPARNMTPKTAFVHTLRRWQHSFFIGTRYIAHSFSIGTWYTANEMKLTSMNESKLLLHFDATRELRACFYLAFLAWTRGLSFLSRSRRGGVFSAGFMKLFSYAV